MKARWVPFNHACNLGLGTIELPGAIKFHEEIPAMQRGRKADPPANKAARGTLQPCRDADRQEIIVPGSPPAQPDYLTPEAIDVWQEEIGRVMSAGVVEIDSSLFARYCSLEALIRKAFEADGEPPPAAYLTEARRMGELLGIAGRKSRVGKVTDDPTKQVNPFRRNGHGAR
jgi:phage terminase small subunit